MQTFLKKIIFVNMGISNVWRSWKVYVPDVWMKFWNLIKIPNFPGLEFRWISGVLRIIQKRISGGAVSSWKFGIHSTKILESGIFRNFKKKSGILEFPEFMWNFGNSGISSEFPEFRNLWISWIFYGISGISEFWNFCGISGISELLNFLNFFMEFSNSGISWIVLGCLGISGISWIYGI